MIYSSKAPIDSRFYRLKVEGREVSTQLILLHGAWHSTLFLLLCVECASSCLLCDFTAKFANNVHAYCDISICCILFIEYRYVIKVIVPVMKATEVEHLHCVSKKQHCCSTL